MQQPGTDLLTGLLNREAFNAALGHSLASGKGFGVLFCDFDRLKLFNDVRGHGDGDALLLSAADALQSVDALQLAGRIGGDEFAALVQCDRLRMGNVAELAWQEMTSATSAFHCELLDQRLAEEDRVRRKGDWPPRKPLGISLVAMWVPPHARMTPRRLMETLFENIDDVRKTQGTGFLLVT